MTEQYLSVTIDDYTDMNFNELREAVFEKTPLFRRVIETHGHKPLLEYFSDNHPESKVHRERQKEMLAVIQKMVRTLIDPTVADEVVEQLRKKYYVSTADHHGPITHPFFVNSHLVQSYAHRAEGYHNVLVFSCGGVSLNNSSFPRGLLFHDKKLHKKRLRFASLKHKHHPIYAFPGYTMQELSDRLIEEYAHLPNEEVTKLDPLMQEIYMNSYMFNYEWYGDQISRTNYALWKKIPGQKNTNLIYLEQEDIANELLLHYHVDSDTLLTKLLTDERYLSAFETYFDGIQGAFSSKENRGTILFWAIHNHERKKLKRTGTTLRTEDGAYEIILTKKNIRRALEKKEMMPSMALTFIILSFYYGLTCGGGFSQVNYLTYMKAAYVKLLEETGHTEELTQLQSIKTDFFCGEFVFATMRNSERTAHASSMDLIMYGNEESEERLHELAKICTLASAVDEMMPEYYKILYGKETDLTPRSRTIALTPCIYV